MYRPQPFNKDNLHCDICGKPAKWIDREFHATYRLGEALCDECNESIYGKSRTKSKEE